MNYDVFIPCAQKDYIKLPFCINGLKNLNPQPDNIFIVSKYKIYMNGITWINEREIIESVPEDIKYRRNNWIFQQILKMCQDVTQQWFLTIDSDLILKNPIELFDNNKPIYRISNHTQFHKPYFSFMEEVFNLEKHVIPSFICDMMVFNKKICREIIPDEKEFVRLLNLYISDDCLFSEFETYGNYIAARYPRSFYCDTLKVDMYGKYLPDLYSTEEVAELVNKETKSDAIVIHSWT